MYHPWLFSEGTAMNISNIAIIGLGLIGGSIAASLKNNNSAISITAFDLNNDSLQYAKNKGIIDISANSVAAAIKDAELIIIAAPINTYSAIFREIKLVLKPWQIITDIASIKREIITVAQKELGEAISQFVPGHPLAGSEKSGMLAATKYLFSECKVLLTPLNSTTTKALLLVTEFWKILGATVSNLNPIKHDEILALTSHLPHVLSFAFMNMIQKSSNRKEILENTAGSFKDFTRIALSDPTLWADVCLTNRENVLTAINLFEQNLAALTQGITNSDRDKLIELFGFVTLPGE